MNNDDWQDWPIAADTHPLDMPGFLCIPQEARREAWLWFNPTGKTGATQTLATGGPGSVCRRAGISDKKQSRRGNGDESVRCDGE